MQNQRPKKPAASTQAYLDIDEIKEGVIVLKDGSLRAVILVSSINFDLKSEGERDAIVSSFQGFLNSLNFPLQILVHSKKIDLSDYISALSQLQQAEEVGPLRDQIENYIYFIQGLLEEVNIMDKGFFAVIPYYPNVIEKNNPLAKYFGKKKTPSADFENEKVQLMDRVDVVVGGLKGVGLNCVSLDTKNLIELFYTLYNPGSSSNQKIKDSAELTTSIIKKGEAPPENMEI